MSSLSIIILLLSITLVTASQLLLKAGARINGNKSFISQYLNLCVAGAYFLFLVVTIVNVYFFSLFPLYYANIMIGASYVTVPLLSRSIFKERLSLQKLLGIFIISVGVIVVGLAN